MEITVTFALEKKRYVNDELVYLDCSTDDEIPASLRKKTKNPGKKKYAFVIAYMDATDFVKSMQKKYTYIATGTLARAEKGQKLKANNIRQVINVLSESDIVEQLVTCKGIGKTIAQDIYAMFKENTFCIIREHPEKLKNVKRITQDKADALHDFFTREDRLREARDYLLNFSLSQSVISVLLDTYGENIKPAVEDNPFLLCSMAGLSFPDANSIALDVQKGLDSPERMGAAIQYVYEQLCARGGHLCVLKQKLLKNTFFILHNDCKCGILKKALLTELDKLREKKIYHYETKYGKDYVYSHKLYICEKETAKKLIDFSHYKQEVHSEQQIQQMIEQSQKENRIQLSGKQKDAIKTAIKSNISIITGGPGTGKTTILKVLVDVFKKMDGGTVRLAAPTGRAARRMAEATGLAEASTIHSLLELKADLQWVEDCVTAKPIAANLLVVDEASMIDMELMYALIHSAPFTCKIVILGDDEQLPSVGPGNVLREMIASQTIPVTTLDVIYRQSDDSAIIKNAAEIRAGRNKFSFNQKDFIFVRKVPEQIEDITVKAYLHALAEGNTVDDIQILSPYRSDKYVASSTRLNQMLQNVINPGNPEKIEFKIGSKTFRQGDKVIQQQNSVKIKNGDIGYIREFYTHGKNTVFAQIEFENTTVAYTVKDMRDNDMDLAYAITGHKAQGGEYKTVILPVVLEHTSMLNRNLIYTIWTRAKERVVMIGDKATLLRCALKENTSKRDTFLAARMRGREAKYRLAGQNAP